MKDTWFLTAAPFLCCLLCGGRIADSANRMSIRIRASQATASYRDSLVLVCEVGTARGHPPLEWRRDTSEVLGPDSGWAKTERELFEVTPRQTPPLYRASILLVSLSANHSYSCQSSLGLTTAVASIKIPVGPLPTVQIERVPQSPVVRGEDVTMTCVTESEVEADVTWQEEPGHRVIVPSALPDPRRTERGFLRYELPLELRPVSKNGTYSCAAQNAYGTKRSSVVVSTKIFPLTSFCKHSLSCGTLGAVCTVQRRCDCPPESPVYVKETDTCYPGVPFGEACSFDAQCRRLDNLTACTAGGRCRCVGHAAYSMDRKACFIPEGEPHRDVVFAGLGGFLFLVVAVDLVVFFLMKRKPGLHGSREELEMTSVAAGGGSSSLGPEEGEDSSSCSEREPSSKASSVSAGKRRYLSSDHSPSPSDASSQRVTPRVIHADRRRTPDTASQKSPAPANGTQGRPKANSTVESVSLGVIRGRELDQPLTRGQSERLKPPSDLLRTHSL